MKGLKLFLIALLPGAVGWLLPKINVIFASGYLGTVQMTEGLLFLAGWYCAGGYWCRRMKGLSRSLLLANLLGITATAAYVLSVLLGFDLYSTILYQIPVLGALTGGQFTIELFAGQLMHQYIFPIFSYDLVGYPFALLLLLLAFLLGYRLKRR